MQKKEEIIENFKTALKSTVKSISNKEDLEINFGNQNITSEKETIILPEIEQNEDNINFEKARAHADSESLKIRYSNREIFKKFLPDGSKAKKLYEIAEK